MFINNINNIGTTLIDLQVTLLTHNEIPINRGRKETLNIDHTVNTFCFCFYRIDKINIISDRKGN